jgi:hypothetical protein
LRSGLARELATWIENIPPFPWAWEAAKEMVDPYMIPRISRALPTSVLFEAAYKWARESAFTMRDKVVDARGF